MTTMVKPLVLANGTVVDGSGAPSRRADVRIHGSSIEAVGSDVVSADCEVVDVSGMVVAPGFIDMHSHSDLKLLTEPDHLAKLSQGVTLEVLGQDGLSYAPMTSAALPHIHSRISGWNGSDAGVDWDWTTVEGYLDRLRNAAVNTAYLVPHGTLRYLVMGDEQRAPTDRELAQMRALLRAGMQQGAIGLSTGLTYVPGMFADTNELIELSGVVAEFGGYYCPHNRNYGEDAIGAYAEGIRIAKESGAGLHYAHAHLSFDANRGRLPELLDLFDAAIDQGVDLTFDAYPYLAGMTTLLSQLPSWAQAGTADQVMQNLKSQETREHIIDALDVSGSDGHQGLTVDWGTVYLAGVPGAPDLDWAIGPSLSEAAAEIGRKPSELCLDILIETELAAPCTIFIGIEEHVRALMQHDRHTVGSDGILVGERPHPRAWGTFPRILQTYVRKEKVLSLPQAVHHMTGSPAKRLALTDRGIVRSGYVADLVVFDAETVGTSATYEDPKNPAIGICMVVIGGGIAYSNGAVTGRRAGQPVHLPTS